MYDMKPYLKRIDEVIKKGPYKDTGNHYHSIRHQIGTRRKVWNFYSLGCV